MSKSSVMKVMLISRNHILRLGVRHILGTQPHLRLVEPRPGEARGDDTIAREQPHIFIIDLEPEMDLSRLLSELRLLVPQTKIILLIGIDERIRAGQIASSEVDGVILNVQPPEVLIACINGFLNRSSASAKALQVIEPTVRRPDWKQAVKPVAGSDPSDVQPASTLSERERTVIRLIGQGLSNKDIADRLCLSATTVRHHLTSIFDKLGVTTRQKLLIRAHQYGLVELSVPA
ncbi:MAG: DNA-binding response regulator [Nitrospiraceae bacterium]